MTLWYVTPAGLGLTNDSAAYIGGARSILAGSGYSDIWLDSPLEPITHYPPLLSLSLSALGLLSLDPYRGARLLNIMLFAANSGMLGWLGWRLTRSQPAALLLTLLYAANAQLLKIHAYALSEPLFLFLSLTAFLCFDLSLAQRRFKWAQAWLLLAGGATGLACLTRYSGLALIGTFLITIFLFRADGRSRFGGGALFLAGALPPLVAWFVRNALMADSATNRSFQYHPIEIKNVRVGLYNSAEFLSPLAAGRDWLFKTESIAWVWVSAGLILLTWLTLATWKLIQTRARPPVSAPPVNPLAFTTGLYVFGYLGAVLFSMTFFDASTKFQHRILAPLYVAGLMLFVYVLRKWTKHTRFLSGLAYGLALLSLASGVYQLQSAVPALRESAGLGYASWKWRQSLVMARLKELPPEVIIYTNSPPAVYHVLERASRVLPSPYNPVSGQPRGHYEQDLEQLRADLLSGRAVLALFNTTDIEDALGVENLEKFASGLTVLEKAQGNILYGTP